MTAKSIVAETAADGRGCRINKVDETAADGRGSLLKSRALNPGPFS